MAETREILLLSMQFYICKNKFGSIHTWWENITKATGAKSHWKSRPSQAMWQEMAWSKRNLYVISAILHFIIYTWRDNLTWSVLDITLTDPAAKGKLDHSFLTTFTTLYLVSQWRHTIPSHKCQKENLK